MRANLRNRAWIWPILFLAGFATHDADRAVWAASTIDSEHSFAWSSNLGWLNARPDESSGAQIGEFVCWGYLYSANVGWIHLGSGMPTNGVRYSNAAAADCGVNHDGRGHLSGFAYGANIGWIQFETNGTPQVDLITGRLSGFAFGANVGWIDLGESNWFLRISALARGDDADGDGIPDAWEILYTGTLGVFSSNTDTDGDGISDPDEYQADTDPLDPNDQLRILKFLPVPGQTQALLSWSTKPSRQYFVETRSDFEPGEAWMDLGSGPLISRDKSYSLSLANFGNPARAYYRIRAALPLSR